MKSFPAEQANIEVEVEREKSMGEKTYNVRPEYRFCFCF